MKDLKIFTDGGSRGNPGSAACAFVVYENKKIIFEKSIYLGQATNNVAEYNGVLEAINWLSNQVTNSQLTISFYLDSELVVKQMRGEYKIKDERLKTLYNKIQFQIFPQSGIQLRRTNFKLNISGWHHVPREQNTRADFLVNQELDKH